MTNRDEITWLAGQSHALSYHYSAQSRPSQTVPFIECGRLLSCFMEGDFCTLHVGCSLGIKFQVIPFSSLTCQSFVCLVLEILAETVMATVRVSKSALFSDE